MGRFYSVAFSAVAVTAQQDFFEIIAATGTRVRLHAFEIWNSSDDATSESEMLRVGVIRATSGYTSGSGGGSNPTPRPLESGDPNASFTCKINNTTRVLAGSGALLTLAETGFNVLSGLVWSPPIPPDRKPSAVGSEALVVSLLRTPADSVTLSGYAIVEEN